MRIKLLLLTFFISFSLALSAQVATTLVLVKFAAGTSEAEIESTFKSIDGLYAYNKSYHITNPDVVMLPIASGDFADIKQQLVNGDNPVTYVAPVYSGPKGEKVTYTDELFAKLKNPADLTQLRKLATTNNATLVGETSFLKNVYKLKVNAKDADALETAKALRKSALFEYTEPNYLFTVLTTAITDSVEEPNDALFFRQWNMLNTGAPSHWNGVESADMNVLDAWQLTMGSPDIKVAILDSGVDTLHEDLVDNLLPGYDARGEGTNGYPTPNFKEDGHGTCCAGIVAAVANNGIGVAGVAPKCKIIPVRVFNYLNLGGSFGVQPWSTGEQFADGITWAWREGKADVASNSWGIPDYILAAIDDDGSQVALVSEALREAITQGREGLGTPYLFSTGNDGLTDTIPIWPARMPETIGVNATSMCDQAKTDTSCDNETWWAGNWGTGVDISAPGVKIPSTDMTGTKGYKPAEYYNTFNGTSAACPNAAGVMALILSANPIIPAAEARRIISVTADTVGGYHYTKDTVAYWSKDLGYGRVNALAAVQLALAYEPPIEQALTSFVYNDESTNESYLHFFLENPSEVAVDIYDIMGKVVKSFPTTVNEGNVNMLINAGELRTGIYILRLNVGGSESSLKFFAYRAK